MPTEQTVSRHPSPAARCIAVIGGSSAPPDVLRAAETVGRELALAGADLVCGGLGGVMEAACRGAREAGGFTIGILPGEDRREANPWVTCAIPTGLGHFRNFLVVRAADGVIALAGGEFDLALRLWREVRIGPPDNPAPANTCPSIAPSPADRTGGPRPGSV